MKNNTPRIDRDKKTIYATKSFLINAGQFGTTEFNTLNDTLCIAAIGFSPFALTSL